jgi:Ca-activated chloride channel family protein
MRRVLVFTAFLAAVVAPISSQPVFRAGTELVRIDALVTDDAVPVEGLTAHDFEVRDNRVAQTVEAITTIESVQLGVVLDASGSMTGERMALARRATSDLLGQLTQADRFSVVAFGDQVGIVANRGTSVAEAVAALESVRAGGGTALLDATFAGILAADGGDGPKLLLVLTDGGNNASWLLAGAVIDAARRHETAVYPVAVDPDRRWPIRVGWFRRTSDSLALLQVIADQTGGRQVDASWDRSLGDVFRTILNEYRQRYILSFTPTGVGSGDGWHDLEVRVKRRGATVRARTRYWSGPKN